MGQVLGKHRLLALCLVDFTKKPKFILQVFSYFEAQFGPQIGFQIFNYP
jgi:hypothetical protein